MKRAIATATAAAVVASAPVPLPAPTADAVPIVGGQGLVPNAAALADYIRTTYPGVQSIGGVRPCDVIGEHCRGLAVDIMIGSNTVLGDTILADIQSQTARFGIRYTMWRVANHHDHIHVTVS